VPARPVRRFLPDAARVRHAPGDRRVAFLENRLAEDVELAFFKINAVLGFGVLGFVATGVGGAL